MLPAIGSPTYIPALLAHLQAEIDGSGAEWTIDPTVFSSLLLSQIAGPERGGCIVDVLPSQRSGQAEGISKVVDSVQVISEGIFGLSTHHVHFSRHSHPSELPYALFKDPSESWPSPRPQRFSSSSSAHPTATRRSTISTPSSKYTSALPSPIFPRAYLSRGSRTPTPGITPSITPKNSTPLLNLHQPSDFGFGPPLIPGRGVSSGAASGRLGDEAEAEFLDGPPREPSLSQCLIISGLESAESSVWGKLVDVLLKRYVQVGSDGQGTGERAVGVEEVPNKSSDRWQLPEAFWVIWVRDEERSEDCPSWLIDQFGSSICVHPDDLHHPSRMPTRAIISQSYIRSINSLLPYTHIHPPLRTHISNLLSALSAHPRLTSCITARTALLFPDIVRAHRLISVPFSLPPNWDKDVETRRSVSAPGSTETRTAVWNGAKGKENWEGDWGVLAGEEPRLNHLSDTVARGETTDDEYQLDVAVANVHSVFALALRHRVAWRVERDEVMWLVKETSEDGVGAGAGAAESKHHVQKEKPRRRRRRGGVDVIMEEITGTVF